MTTMLPPSDDDLRDALRREPSSGLAWLVADAVADEIAQTPQQRTVPSIGAWGRPDRPRGWHMAATGPDSRRRSSAWSRRRESRPSSWAPCFATRRRCGTARSRSPRRRGAWSSSAASNHWPMARPGSRAPRWPGRRTAAGSRSGREPRPIPRPACRGTPGSSRSWTCGAARSSARSPKACPGRWSRTARSSGRRTDGGSSSACSRTDRPRSSSPTRPRAASRGWAPPIPTRSSRPGRLTGGG